ncbi:MAG: hypothetical protein AB8B48_17445, partial [Pseudomonadales bacterium]
MAVIFATLLLFVIWWFLAGERTHFGALSFVATTSIYSVCLLVFHITKNRLLACHLFIAILAASIFMSVTVTGGTDSPVVAILIIVP